MSQILEQSKHNDELGGQDENQGANSSDIYAAIDLGSNSFHMVISRHERDEFVVVDRQKTTVRLAAGFDENNCLTKEAEDRALNTLEQFSQLLRNVPSQNVRAVGTNAMRRMKNSDAFLEKAESVLGAPIEIIAGREEARLIYLGVTKGIEFGEGNRLVVDIGGGSTEVVVGNAQGPIKRESLEAGCVVLSQRYFQDGNLNEDSFEQAILDVELALQPVVKMFKTQGWEMAIGCSGTIKALSSVLDELGLAQGEITKKALQKLYSQVIGYSNVSEISFISLNDDRKPVFAGGLSVMLGVFEVLGIEQMQISDCALRDGVLYDLLGRSSEEDVRDVAVNSLVERCGVDQTHANYVKSTALKLYDDVASSWGIDSDPLLKMLSWSAMTHEIGMLISHDAYHKHGAYLIQNADMVGFARRDQALLACLIKGHRRKFPLTDFEHLPAALVTPAKRLAVLLRLGVLLHRTRSIVLPAELSASAKGSDIQLSFPAGWIESNPLTRADLQLEKKRLTKIGINLTF